MQDLQKRLTALKSGTVSAWEKLNINTKITELANLEEQSASPELWSNPDNALAVNTKLSTIRDQTLGWTILRTQIDDIDELLLLDSVDLLPEITAQLTAMEENFANLKKSLRFNGKYDNFNAIIRITAGVGGTEAMDWAGMLERMYLRFFEKSNFKVTSLERTTGEEAGIKTAVYEITGANVYGNLKSEHGVHRLIRLSPFNADNLRQTSFSLVEVLPIVPETEVKIDEKDLRIDVYRSGGHGGQSVNTTDSAVRITHLPTNTVVAIQNERSQLQNRAKAMEILRGKLLQLQQEQHANSINELRAGESGGWGQQIRNYILQPYKLVKDTRTKHEETDTDAILDGKIDGFIDAYLESIIGDSSTK